MTEILVIAILVTLLVGEKALHILAERRWAAERKDLLDRIMARDFDAYASVASSQRSVVSEPEATEDGKTSEWPAEDDELGVSPDEYRDLAAASEAGYQHFVGPVRTE